MDNVIFAPVRFKGRKTAFGKETRMQRFGDLAIQ